MLLFVAALVLGLLVLVWSADRFVDAAAAFAWHLKVSSFVIGVVIIGFGTSAPELVVSAFAASAGNPGLALGNGYGSNIANIGLVLGLVLLLAAMPMDANIKQRQLPLLLVVTGLAGLLLLNGQLSRWDGALLLLLFALAMVLSLWHSEPQAESATDFAHLSDPLSFKKSIWMLLGSLVLLILSSRLLVWGAVNVASALGVSDLIIGLTVVAVGTSLPELAAALASVRQRQQAMILGNILGSALFNTLAVVGLAALIRPLEVDVLVLCRDWLLMFGLTLLLWLLAWRAKPQLDRPVGLVLLLVYGLYCASLVWLVWQA